MHIKALNNFKVLKKPIIQLYRIIIKYDQQAGGVSMYNTVAVFGNPVFRVPPRLVQAACTVSHGPFFRFIANMELNPSAIPPPAYAANQASILLIVFLAPSQ